ncbi:heterokaryon incompatibility, partial [Thozetella sp. PMI_491]
NPTYEALSYSWDDPYAPSLLPNGKYTVLVTPNLFLALRALQLENKPRSLWIDALCINQSSAEEKSRQIPRMRDIYSKATKVVIWLGEQDWWTRGSVSVINRWAAEWRTFENEEQACFEALVRRAWFTRAWTFQELCLAQ